MANNAVVVGSRANNTKLIIFHQDLWNERPCVVSGRHDAAIGARTFDKYQVTSLLRGEPSFACKSVRGLANRTDDVVKHVLIPTVSLRNNIVVCVVHAWTQKIIHRGVDYQERRNAAFLNVDDAAYENSSVANNRPPRLKN